MFQQFLPDFKISVGQIGDISGIPDTLDSPFYSTGVGIMQFACFEESRLAVIKEEEKVIVTDSGKGFINKIKNMINR